MSGSHNAMSNRLWRHHKKVTTESATRIGFVQIAFIMDALSQVPFLALWCCEVHLRNKRQSNTLHTMRYSLQSMKMMTMIVTITKMNKDDDDSHQAGALTESRLTAVQCRTIRKSKTPSYWLVVASVHVKCFLCLYIYNRRYIKTLCRMYIPHAPSTRSLSHYGMGKWLHSRLCYYPPCPNCNANSFD